MKMLLYVRWWVVGMLVLFLVWQMWVFLSPKPRMLDAAELKATERVCEEVVAAISKNGYEVAVATFYHWEVARREPPLDAFPAIAGALGLKIRTLFPTE